jgi:hypothetical protein
MVDLDLSPVKPKVVKTKIVKENGDFDNIAEEQKV